MSWFETESDACVSCVNDIGGWFVGVCVSGMVSAEIGGMSTTRYRDNSSAAKALGLQPGELYEETEECHTCVAHYEHKGRKFEIYFDEMAGPFTQWKAFCQGIGTRSNMERDKALAAMRLAIDNAQP